MVPEADTVCFIVPVVTVTTWVVVVTPGPVEPLGPEPDADARTGGQEDDHRGDDQVALVPGP